MDINFLVKITSRAWSLKILALLHQGLPGRQAPLLSAAQASRTAFAASLSHLVDLELLERNPGHGHPLRPEFRLTLKGVEIAKIAAEIVGTTATPSETAILRKSWTVPILAVTKVPRHFIEIKSELPSLTDRALSQSLGLLHEQNWLLRNVDASNWPPRPIYQAANTGIKINKAISLSSTY